MADSDNSRFQRQSGTIASPAGEEHHSAPQGSTREVLADITNASWDSQSSSNAPLPHLVPSDAVRGSTTRRPHPDTAVAAKEFEAGPSEIMVMDQSAAVTSSSSDPPSHEMELEIETMNRLEQDESYEMPHEFQLDDEVFTNWRYPPKQ